MRLIYRLIAVASAAFFYAGTASAQWQTPDHSIPVGRGGGTGFKFAAPGTAGLPLVSNGASSDPSFQSIGAASFGTQTANRVLAGPTSGGAATPTFRALVGADLPTPGASSLGGVQSFTCSTSNWFNTLSTGGVFGCSQPAFSDLSGALTAAQATAALSALTGCTTQGGVLYRNATVWVCLAPGTSGQVLSTGGAGSNPSWISVGGTGTVTSVAAGTGMSFTTIVGSGSVSIDKASSANLEAGTADKVLTADNIFDAEKTITYAASQTFDFSTFLNGRVTLTGNITSLTCSNIKASQSGTITLVQDGTGSRTMVAAWCSQFRWTGGVRGVLSTAASSIDALFYTCISSSVCYVSLGRAQAN